MPTPLGKEIVWTGEGEVRINGVPYAYIDSVKISYEGNKVELKRWHDSVPDRVLFQDAKVTGSISMKNHITQDLATLGFKPVTTTVKMPLVADGVVTSDGAGGYEISLTGVIPTDWDLDTESVSIVWSDTFEVEKIPSSEVPYTAGSSDFTITGRAAAEEGRTGKVYFTVTQSSVTAYTYGEGSDVEVQIRIKAHPYGNTTVINIPRARIKPPSFDFGTEPAQATELSFDALADEKGIAIYVYEYEPTS